MKLVVAAFFVVANLILLFGGLDDSSWKDTLAFALFVAFVSFAIWNEAKR